MNTGSTAVTLAGPLRPPARTVWTTGQAHGISDGMWQMYRPLAYRDTWSVIPMLLRPKSRGRIRYLGFVIFGS